MKTHARTALIFAFCVSCQAAASPNATIPALPDPASFSATAKAFPELLTMRAELKSDRDKLRERTKQQNVECNKVEEGSAQSARCDTLLADLQSDIDSHISATYAFIEKLTINAMHVHVLALPDWTPAERSRLDAALMALGHDGDPNATAAQVRATWATILARGSNKALASEAARGQGAALSNAGKQSHEDCAVFALANAANLPYSVVAARATNLIRDGEWRNSVERGHPQAALENQGLMGGEVLILAEAFGQADVVKSDSFVSTLSSGRPIMIGVVPTTGAFGDGHEVVLSRTFQHDGKSWFELIDSNQAGMARLYASADELHIILKENGVAFRPAPGTTPKLLH